MNWFFKGFLDNIITTKSTRKLNYINLGIRKEFVRFHTNEHQTHILRLNVFWQGTNNIHILAHFNKIPFMFHRAKPVKCFLPVLCFIPIQASL